jgi:hypothetical protein
MTLADMRSLNSEELVIVYVEIGLLMFEESDNLDTVEYNKNFEIFRELSAELMSRSGDHRRLLLPLLKHENPQVKLNAANNLAAIELLAARKAFHELVELNYLPQSADAGMALDILNGDSKLKDVNWPN